MPFDLFPRFCFIAVKSRTKCLPMLNVSKNVFCLNTRPFSTKRLASSNDVSAALRPFYFLVHPDRFMNHPEQKNTNELSLQTLNSYLESILKAEYVKPIKVHFFLRKSNTDEITQNNVVPFRTIQIHLESNDLNTLVIRILESCDLAAGNVRIIQNREEKKSQVDNAFDDYAELFREKRPLWTDADQVYEAVRAHKEFDLSKFLFENTDKAMEKQKACEPSRIECEKLAQELTKSLGLKSISWDCTWGISHYRGCLLSFQNLIKYNPEGLDVLRGRALVFGNVTGVSFDGAIILSSEDVRHNWLRLIRSIDKQLPYVEEIPSLELGLSSALQNIVIRRSLQVAQAKKYVSYLRKITTAIHRYKWQNQLPVWWPPNLDEFELIVEAESGPLALSSSGQFITPASCPASLLVSFISDNLEEARLRKAQHHNDENIEAEIVDRCLWKFGLYALTKDHNITPTRMIECCERLLEDADLFWSYLRDNRLHISQYYSVFQEGIICIPWFWTDRKQSRAPSSAS